MDNIPVCTNWSMLAHFGKEYERIMFMFQDDLIKATNCSLPCTFLEYKVIEKVKEPLDGEIEFWLSIASKSMEVLREELSYPFLSLVADIGGVLGLFIGFNFLMIWDGILFCVRNKFSIKKHK